MEFWLLYMGQRRDSHHKWRVQVRGNLNNGAHYGLFAANLNNALSNSNWNYAARITGKQRQ